MADRYWVPISLPCRLSCVGSCAMKNASSSSSYEISAGRYTTLMASAWPVRPVVTCLYVGLATFPPVYPEITVSTPANCWNWTSVHQKHPPANVAVSTPANESPLAVNSCVCGGFESVACKHAACSTAPPISRKNNNLIILVFLLNKDTKAQAGLSGKYAKYTILGSHESTPTESLRYRQDDFTELCGLVHLAQRGFRFFQRVGGMD